jgi:hypothetical protein
MDKGHESWWIVMSSNRFELIVRLYADFGCRRPRIQVKRSLML